MSEQTGGGKKPTASEAAKALGRLGGLKGGKARAASMTPEERSAIARKAVLTRWAKARAGEVLKALEKDPEKIGTIVEKAVAAALTPKPLLAQVAFDLIDADSEDYKSLGKALQGIGLNAYQLDRGLKPRKLPFNTFAGTFEEQPSAELASTLFVRIEAVFKQLGIRGRTFVAVGRDYAWDIKRLG